MAAAIQRGDAQAIAAFPKYVPRGKPIPWDLERAERDMEDSRRAGELAEALSAMERENRLDRLTVDEKCEAIDHGLHTLLCLQEGVLLNDLPKLLQGLSSQQHAMYRARASRLYEQSLHQFDAPPSTEAEDPEEAGHRGTFHLHTLPSLLESDGSVWYPLVPICLALWLDPKAVHAWLGPDEQALKWMAIEGRFGQHWYVSPQGLWRLLVSSQHPACERLQRWLVHVVIPSLLVEGQYTCGPEARAVLEDLPARPQEPER
jgi:hypothetical protein